VKPCETVKPGIHLDLVVQILGKLVFFLQISFGAKLTLPGIRVRQGAESLFPMVGVFPWDKSAMTVVFFPEHVAPQNGTKHDISDSGHVLSHCIPMMVGLKVYSLFLCLLNHQ